jgi:integrase
MLRLAVNRELIDYNPAQDISVMPVKDRDRCLSEPELKAFWKACELPHELDGLALSIEMGLALRMAAVTLQRGGEVVGMRWSELDIDNRVWSIPPDRMKSARPHAVPLSEQAITLLEQSKGLHAKATDYVFLSPRSTNHIERRAFSRAMNRIVKVLGMPRATPHDLRRTGATMLTSERIGISRFIVSQVLGHSSDTGGAAAVTGIYDRYAYLPEKRRALNAWAAHLMQIVGENEETSTVINMRLS